MKPERIEQITPESPARLRECLTALAAIQQHHVLRVEVSLDAQSTTGPHPALTMTVTHSLGPEHEERIAKPIAEVFYGCLRGLAAGVEVEVEDQDEAGPNEGNTPEPER